MRRVDASAGDDGATALFSILDEEGSVLSSSSSILEALSALGEPQRLIDVQACTSLPGSWGVPSSGLELPESVVTEKAREDLADLNRKLELGATLGASEPLTPPVVLEAALAVSATQATAASPGEFRAALSSGL